MIKNKTFDEINIGDTASLTRVLTEDDVKMFARLSGDVNPAHLDAEYAKNDIFGGVVGHGMWAGALISTVLGTKLPGPGTIYLGQTLKFLKPVRIGDTMTVSVKVLEKRDDKKLVKLECSCINQKNEQVLSGEANVIAPTEKVERQPVILPDLAFVSDLAPQYYSRLQVMVKDMEPVRTAIVHATDASSFMGAIEAAQDSIISPVFIGPIEKMKRIASECGVPLDSYECISVAHSHEAAEVAVEMARNGKVDMIVKGQLHTDELMHPVVQKDGLRTERKMSHVFMVLVPYYHKPLFITDAAINIFPDLMTKRDIVQNAVDLFHCLYSSKPKVGILSAVETVTERLPATLDATALCKMAERGQIYGCIIDGPLAFDNAISADAARLKNINSPVSGDIDIVVVPNIESGNIMFKQLRYLSQADGAGIVLGASVPIVLTSRSEDSPMSRKLSCILGALYSGNRCLVGIPLKPLESHA